MLAKLIEFLSIPILNSLVDAYKAKLAAANTADAKAVELAMADIEAEKARRSAQRDLGIAAMGHPVWWLAWSLFVIPVGVYNAAIFTLSILSIPPDTYAVLRVPLEQERLARDVIEYLFLAQGGAGIAGAIIGRFAKR